MTDYDALLFNENGIDMKIIKAIESRVCCPVEMVRSIGMVRGAVAMYDTVTWILHTGSGDLRYVQELNPDDLELGGDQVVSWIDVFANEIRK